jgi:hypothetical protein
MEQDGMQIRLPQDTSLLIFFSLVWGIGTSCTICFPRNINYLFGINVNNILLSSVCDMMTVMTTVTLLKTSFAVPKVSEKPPNAIESHGGKDDFKL